ncbi:MAG: magnesium/cobalt transporter CorA [Bacillota bacterium]|nr:magnesium/cobalt transporter CorA [Bacillota bacterium]
MMKIVRQSHKAGLPPGTLIHTGDLKSKTSLVTFCKYGDTIYREEKTNDLNKIHSLLIEPAPVTWINIDGLGRIDLLSEVGSYYNLHHLTLEDILDTEQRPRQEAYEDYTYIICRALVFNENTDDIESEQVSLVMGNNYVISVSERETDLFKAMRKRIELNKGSARKESPDYLAYSLLDIIVDQYYIVIEKAGERLEALEEALLAKPDESTLQAVHRLKRNMISMRQAVWPLREALVGLEQSDAVFNHPSVALHLRDVYSHVVQIIDTVDIYREMLSGLIEIYLSSVNNRLNEVMKILTIFAAIFIPLTLISGIYGMNFVYMPELNWLYGYPFALGLMAAVAVVLLLYFKRKKWL